MSVKFNWLSWIKKRKRKKANGNSVRLTRVKFLLWDFIPIDFALFPAHYKWSIDSRLCFYRAVIQFNLKWDLVSNNKQTEERKKVHINSNIVNECLILSDMTKHHDRSVRHEPGQNMLIS